MVPSRAIHESPLHFLIRSLLLRPPLTRGLSAKLTGGEKNEQLDANFRTFSNISVRFLSLRASPTSLVRGRHLIESLHKTSSFKCYSVLQSRRSFSQTVGRPPTVRTTKFFRNFVRNSPTFRRITSERINQRRNPHG